MTGAGAVGEGPEGLGLLASALAGRGLRVAAGAPGEPAWTDGRAIFVDPGSSRREQIEALAAQAALLAAGSLDPERLRPLARRSALARRYLALEGHRALASIADVLPRPARLLLDPRVAARVDSPEASLEVARGREAIDDAPRSFGEIRAKKLLAAVERSAREPTGAPPSAPEPGEALTALADEDDAIEDTGLDVFAGPAGTGGAVGRWLGKLLEAARSVRGGGPPNVGTPTHRARTGLPTSRGHALATAAAASLEDTGVAEETRGRRYPEWDVHRHGYRPDWCSVLEIAAESKAGPAVASHDRHGLRRPLARLGMGLDRVHRQAQGDDVDLDAAVEARVEWLAGSPPDEAVYIDSVRRRRDLAVLLLLDVSGSAGEPAADGKTVHEQQRDVAVSLLAALHAIGDRVALYAFRSQGRRAVHVLPIKRFDEGFDSAALRRLHGLQPGAFSRLGAAIRHGAAVLEERGGTSRPLLVVLSDGLAYDHGYEPGYGAADARRALAEARRRGIGCLCLGIGAQTEADTLRKVFGSAAHATIPRPEQLGRVIGPLFRSALRSAEVRRRVAA